MASHFISLARGEEGFLFSDFTIGVASSAGDLFEFRVLDGVTPKRIEAIKALEAFRRVFENAQQLAGTGFDVGV